MFRSIFILTCFYIQYKSVAMATMIFDRKWRHVLNFLENSVKLKKVKSFGELNSLGQTLQQSLSCLSTTSYPNIKLWFLTDWISWSLAPEILHALETVDTASDEESEYLWHSLLRYSLGYYYYCREKSSVVTTHAVMHRFRAYTHDTTHL